LDAFLQNKTEDATIIVSSMLNGNDWYDDFAPPAVAEFLGGIASIRNNNLPSAGNGACAGNFRYRYYGGCR
jgi:hypothetical protein